MRGRALAKAGAVDDLVARLERDRAELAASLDAAEARVQRLEQANQDVAARLVKVMERLRITDEDLGIFSDRSEGPSGSNSGGTLQ